MHAHQAGSGVHWSWYCTSFQCCPEQGDRRHTYGVLREMHFNMQICVDVESDVGSLVNRHSREWVRAASTGPGLFNVPSIPWLARQSNRLTAQRSRWKCHPLGFQFEHIALITAVIHCLSRTPDACSGMRSHATCKMVALPQWLVSPWLDAVMQSATAEP